MSRSAFYDRLVYMDRTSAFTWTIDPLSSSISQKLRKLPVAYRFKLRASEAARPALISYRAYRTVDLWFVVNEYNGIMHHLELVQGMKLVLPSLADVDALLRSQGGSALTFANAIANQTGIVAFSGSKDTALQDAPTVNMNRIISV